MRGWGLILLAAAIVLPAAAGPWGRVESELYTRVAASRVLLESLDAVRLDSYAEYGFAPNWTATLKYERLQFDDIGAFDRDGWRATARRSFSLSPTMVASLEGGLLQGSAIGGASGCETLGSEARAGVGQSLQLGKTQQLDIFWFAEGAVRAHEDGCVRRRFEAGYGQNVFGDVWAISQAWIDDGTSNASSRKYQFELLWKADFAEVSAGTTTELGGQFEETAFFLAVARTF